MNFKFLEKNPVMIFALSLAFILLVLLFFPSLRGRLQKHFDISQTRSLVAKISGSLKGDTSTQTILKFQKGDDMVIEIHEGESEQMSKKLFEFTYKNTRDSHFNSINGASNLLLQDVTGDGVYDVVVPLRNQVNESYLSSIYFNPETLNFQFQNP